MTPTKFSNYTNPARRIPSEDQLRRVFGANAGRARELLEMDGEEIVWEVEQAGKTREWIGMTEPRGARIEELRMGLLGLLAGAHDVKYLPTGIHDEDGGGDVTVLYLDKGGIYSATLMAMWSTVGRGIGPVTYRVGSRGDLVEERGWEHNPVRPRRGETRAEFMARCMHEEKRKFPRQDQRVAVCMSKGRANPVTSLEDYEP